MLNDNKIARLDWFRAEGKDRMPIILTLPTTSSCSPRFRDRWRRLAAVAGLFASLAAPLACRADPGDWSWSDSSNYIPESVWINPGDLSYHFSRSDNFRGDNWGFGAQIDFPHDLALLGGTFINSDRQRSYDAGLLWEPYSLGPIKLGAVAGAFNGYPYYRNGAWFPALLPMASVSYERVGANVTILPNYKNKLHGALVVQLIFKVW